jgi:hypothetical protein
MYWYKPKSTIAVVLIGSIALLTFGSACKPDIKETGAAVKYFDIKQYFAGEIKRLTGLNKPVEKSVGQNGAIENKKVTINNWGQELDLFAEADINRPAWKNSYTIQDNDGLLVYRAKYPELKMREMVIKKDGEKVKWILIFNKTKNILYQTTEKLSYFPDSLYDIEKDQKVRLLGANHYEIKGLMK